MDKVEQQLAESRAAERLLLDEAFDRTCADLEREAFDAWRHSRPNEAGKREECYYLMQAFGQLRKRLEVIRDGKPMPMIKQQLLRKQ